jgi:hypothetical protein
LGIPVAGNNGTINLMYDKISFIVIIFSIFVFVILSLRFLNKPKYKGDRLYGTVNLMALFFSVYTPLMRLLFL